MALSPRIALLTVGVAWLISLVPCLASCGWLSCSPVPSPLLLLRPAPSRMLSLRLLSCTCVFGFLIDMSLFSSPPSLHPAPSSVIVCVYLCVCGCVDSRVFVVRCILRDVVWMLVLRRGRSRSRSGDKSSAAKNPHLGLGETLMCLHGNLGGC